MSSALCHASPNTCLTSCWGQVARTGSRGHIPPRLRTVSELPAAACSAPRWRAPHVRTGRNPAGTGTSSGSRSTRAMPNLYRHTTHLRSALVVAESSESDGGPARYLIAQAGSDAIAVPLVCKVGWLLPVQSASLRAHDVPPSGNIPHATLAMASTGKGHHSAVELCHNTMAAGTMSQGC